jgi:hypothetical protein
VDGTRLINFGDSACAIVTDDDDAVASQTIAKYLPPVLYYLARRAPDRGGFQIRQDWLKPIWINPFVGLPCRLQGGLAS